MGERSPYKAEVTGSIPVPPTITYVVMEVRNAFRQGFGVRSAERRTTKKTGGVLFSTLRTF